MPVLPDVGDLFGRYRIDRQIGYGGMGVVYAATDTELGRTVALKVMHAALGEQEFLERFGREAEVLARLNSPHVIAIYDVGEHEGSPYIVTQFISGGDLGDLIKARGPMPPHLAATVCAQVAEALSDAHRVGVIHRDVKPSNVLLRNPDDVREPMVYLCDFGIAHTETDGFTRAGTVSGTWSYLSPECGRGEPASVASDVYALGCLLWAALSGRAPYSGTDVEIAVAHQTAPIPQLAGDDELSAAVNQVLRTSMAKEPWARYADADQLRDALMALRRLPVPEGGLVPAPLGGDTGASSGTGLVALTSRRGDGLAYAPKPPRRRGLAVAAAATALVVVAGGGTALALTSPWSSAKPSDPSGGESGGAGTVAEGPVRGDVDSDGLGDVVTYPLANNAFDKTVRYDVTTFASDGEALTPTTEEQVVDSSGVRSLVSGDFDGDGTSELGTIGRDNAEDDLMFTADLSGGGTLASPVTAPEQPGRYTGFDVDDLDGDGVDDLFWLNIDIEAGTPGYTGELRLYVLRLQDGELAEPVTLLTRKDGSRVSEVAVGDVNGDQKADVAVLDQFPQHDNGAYEGRSELTTWIGDGETVTESSESASFQRTNISHFNLADIDADGQDELVLIQFALDNDEIRQAEFVDGVLQQPRTRGAFTIPDTLDGIDHGYTLSDVDGDGRVDAVHVTKTKAEEPYRVEVALSNGTHFSTPTTWATWEGGPQSVISADLMGDDLL